MIADIHGVSKVYGIGEVGAAAAAGDEGGAVVHLHVALSRAPGRREGSTGERGLVDLDGLRPLLTPFHSARCLLPSCT